MAYHQVPSPPLVSRPCCSLVLMASTFRVPSGGRMEVGRGVGVEEMELLLFWSDGGGVLLLEPRCIPERSCGAEAKAPLGAVGGEFTRGGEL